MLKPKLNLGPLIKLPRLSSQRYSSTTKPSAPLKILFCGSDEFSASSLAALHAEHQTNPSLIHSISVLVRPPKPTGRGLKVLREVPLQSFAHSLSLPLITLNTFTGWTPDREYNLVIAVSFGLFVPRRILRSAAYGGLNVHPSLLPDLRGPAPLHRALLEGRGRTGVSLQTLSETGFDSGTVLAQTALPGIEIPEGCTVPQLRDLLAREGAGMLVRGLREGVHVPPLVDVGWKPSEEERKWMAHAPKVTKADSLVRWGVWTAEIMERRARVLEAPLWSWALGRDGNRKRVILRGVEAVEGREGTMGEEGPARFVAWSGEELEVDGGKPEWKVLRYFRDSSTDDGAVVIPVHDGGWVRVREMHVEGRKLGKAAAAIEHIAHSEDEIRRLDDESDTMLDFAAAHA
jgi:methionyl-tRNA formyltransferase